MLTSWPHMPEAYPVLGYPIRGFLLLRMDKTIHSQAYGQVLLLLRQLREEAGLRQVDLATLLAEPQSFVSKVETGERRLDIIELWTICKALGTDLKSFSRQLEAELGK